MVKRRFTIALLDSTAEILKQRAVELGFQTECHDGHCSLGRELIELGLGLRTELSKKAGDKQD